MVCWRHGGNERGVPTGVDVSRVSEAGRPTAPGTGDLRIMEHVPDRHPGFAGIGPQGRPFFFATFSTAFRDVWYGPGDHAVRCSGPGWLILARGLTPSDDARLAGDLFPSSDWRDGPVPSTLRGTRGRTVSARVIGSSRSTGSAGGPSGWRPLYGAMTWHVGERLSYTVVRAGRRDGRGGHPAPL